MSQNGQAHFKAAFRNMLGHYALKGQVKICLFNGRLS